MYTKGILKQLKTTEDYLLHAMGTDNMGLPLAATLAGLGARTSHSESWPEVGSNDVTARSDKILRPFQLPSHLPIGFP